MTSLLPAPFRLEREMFGSLLPGVVPRLFGRRAPRVAVLREPMIGSVIPDLLLGAWPERRRPAPRAKSTTVEAHVAALLEREGPLSQEEIVARLYLTREVSARSLRALTRRGVIATVRTGPRAGAIALSPSARTAGLEIVAVELKLRRWRDALAQAERYRAFADRAYVVVDGAQIVPTATMCALFQLAGVGLLVQARAELTLLVEARSAVALMPQRVHAADALFAADEFPRTLARATTGAATAC